ncbi:transposable element Tcb1 transposase [Trichonephila clavipes]|nr:transposable element Tcb1 transposase [Trichonephila clavipes]
MLYEVFCSSLGVTIFSKFAVFAFTSSTDLKSVPFNTAFPFRSKYKSNGERSCGYGGFYSTVISLSAENCFTKSTMCMGALSREIGSRVGRNQTTVTLICDRWMQEGTTDRRGRSHSPHYITSHEDRQIVSMAVTNRSVPSRTVAQHITHLSATARWSDSSLETTWKERNSCVMHSHTGPAPGIMVWGGIGYYSRILLVRIASTLNNQRYISEVLEPVVIPYLQGLATAILQQDNARPHVARIV